MAVNRWIGRAAFATQVDSFTPANVGIGNTFSIEINTKVVTFTATANTVANVTAGLVALLQASNDGEFKDMTWSDQTTYIKATSRRAGTPFTATSSASGGTATLTRAAVTANSSPNDVNDPKNWSLNALPSVTDDIVVDAGNISMLWNLGALSAITVVSFTRLKGYTGKVGLPEYNANGNYFEYRATELTLSATTYNLDQPTSDRPEQIKINAGSVQFTMNVNGDGKGALNQERLWVRGTNASNTLNMKNASVAIAPVADTPANINILNCVDSIVRIGIGKTIGTVVTANSLIDTLSTIAALGSQTGKQCETRIRGSATITASPTVQDGKITWMSDGTIPASTIGTGVEFDLSKDNRSRALGGSMTMRKGATWRDPFGTTSGTLTIASDTDLAELKIITKPGKTIAIS